jgi:GNAT superfamily N-acetyltransferase
MGGWLAVIRSSVNPPLAILVSRLISNKGLKLNYPPIEVRREDYVISTNPARLDAQAIHAYLTSSYWARGIPLATVEKSLRGSLCFGLYHGAEQVGLARVISDFATYAYLCDVYIVESHRGAGLGKWLMETVVSHPALQGLRRFTLATRDAHGLYRQFGFLPLAEPDRHMEISVPDIYGPSSSENCC